MYADDGLSASRGFTLIYCIYFILRSVMLHFYPQDHYQKAPPTVPNGRNQVQRTAVY